MTNHEQNYLSELERLWDMLSDMIEGGRLTAADVPDDYQALVAKLAECAAVGWLAECAGAANLLTTE